jgi:hypothetical protein
VLRLSPFRRLLLVGAAAVLAPLGVAGRRDLERSGRCCGRPGGDTLDDQEIAAVAAYYQQVQSTLKAAESQGKVPRMPPSS